MLMKYVLLYLLLSLSVFVRAQELPLVSQQEITHLISYLENSGCRFNRNGSWYSAADAVKHINKKYQYLLEKNAVASAEVFIEKAASESSMSGKAYLVQCGDAPPEASEVWFTAELKKYRHKASDTK